METLYHTVPIMETATSLKELIDQASSIAGSLRKLAGLLEMNPAHLSDMRNGKRPCNWRVRGGLRAITGEDPARAFMAAIAEDLAASEKPDEKKAAESFAAILAAFPASTGGNGGIRTLDEALHPILP